MDTIRFHAEDVEFIPPQPRKTSNWLKSVIKSEKRQLSEVNYIFCSDEYLLSLNREYLNHKTLTDIITFDNSEVKNEIEGDIFISIDRIHENAAKFNVPFEVELRRVLVHGVLHLIGFKDKTDRDRKVMRKKEDAYLSLYNE